MDRGLGLFLVGLVFGGGIGFVGAASQGVTLDGHDHSDPAHHGALGDHAEHQKQHDTPLGVSGTNAPQVSASLIKDPMSGYNLMLETQNFTFSPEAASGAHQAGEGHAHVYVNDQKLARLYGPWMHIADLPKGDVTIRVSLNANDHRVYSVNGAPVSADLKVTID